MAAVFLLARNTPALAIPPEEFAQAAQRYQKGEFAPADFIALCEAELVGDALENPAYQSEIYANRALALFNLGDLEKAKSDNAKAFELNPQSVRAMMNQGIMLNAAGKHIEAYVYMKNAAASVERTPQIQKEFQAKAIEYRDAAAITPNVLWQAFDANEIAAEDAYKGKIVVVQGIVNTITSDMDGNPMISFYADETGLVQVHCIFPPEDRSIIARLKKGQTITVAGLCDGMTMGHVFLKNATTK